MGNRTESMLARCRGRKTLERLGARGRNCRQPSPVLPFNDPSRQALVKVGAWLVGIALVVVLLNLLGVDVVGWLQDAWDQIQDVPAGYIVAGLVFQTGQTLFAGLSYYGILRGVSRPGRILADRDRVRRPASR